jgi:hypothetical protein
MTSVPAKIERNEKQDFKGPTNTGIRDTMYKFTKE